MAPTISFAINSCHVLLIRAFLSFVPVNSVPSAAYSCARLIADLERFGADLMDRGSLKCWRVR